MQFALLISVLIALLLGAFLMLTHMQSFFRLKSLEILQISRSSNQEILKFIQTPQLKKDTLVIQEDQTTKKLTSKYYGAWTKVFSEVEIHNQNISKSALVGSKVSTKTPNLYLANTNSPLVIVGKTRIEGTSYLPKQGIKAGNISGNYYQGSSLYYGNIVESKETLPELDKNWISYIKALIKGEFIDQENNIPLKNEVKNSFNTSEQIIYNPGPIVLGAEKITGNIIIQSNTKIVVHPTAILENVLLVAPEIVIMDNVKGSMQMVASKKIQVGKNCHLSYPSSITLLDQNKVFKNSNNTASVVNRNPNILIKTNTLIQGAVVYIPKQTDAQNRIKTDLKIESNSEIIGEIYCQGNLEFQGKIRGSLYTKKFVANQSGSIYLNHIYNGEILKNPIPDYVGLPFTNTQYSIAKWLY